MNINIQYFYCHTYIEIKKEIIKRKEKESNKTVEIYKPGG